MVFNTAIASNYIVFSFDTLNALAPIVSTEVGIITEARLVSSQADSPIVLTLESGSNIEQLHIR